MEIYWAEQVVAADLRVEQWTPVLISSLNNGRMTWRLTETHYTCIVTELHCQKHISSSSSFLFQHLLCVLAPQALVSQKWTVKLWAAPRAQPRGVKWASHCWTFGQELNKSSLSGFNSFHTNVVIILTSVPDCSKREKIIILQLDAIAESQTMGNHAESSENMSFLFISDINLRENQVLVLVISVAIFHLRSVETVGFSCLLNH